MDSLVGVSLSSTDVNIKFVGCLVLSFARSDSVGVLTGLSFIEYRSYPLMIPADVNSFLIEGTDWERFINDCGNDELNNLDALGSSVTVGSGEKPAIGCSCNRSVSGLTNFDVPRLEPAPSPANENFGRLARDSFPRLLLMLNSELPVLPLLLLLLELLLPDGGVGGLT